MRKNKYLFIFLLFGFLSVLYLGSCGNRFRVDISDIPPANVQIQRYEKALFAEDLNAERVEFLREEFPLFLGDLPLDSIQRRQLMSYVSDPFLQKVYAQTEKVFPNLDIQNRELSEAFTYVKYYFSDFKYPSVYSYLSGVQDHVFYQDQIVMVSLDHFLGYDNEIYHQLNIPRYKQASMSQEYISKEVILAIAKTYIPQIDADANLLEQMIYNGKLLFFVKSMLPEISEEVLSAYTKEQLEWIQSKESDLWRYYMENELLYKTDFMVSNKFIKDGPFTSVLGDDSSPRTGIWLGYRIVLSYMNHQDKSLQALILNKDAQLILQQSAYKPARN